MHFTLSNRERRSPCAVGRWAGVCAFVLGLLGAANAWADCNDFLLQYGRFRGGATAHLSNELKAFAGNGLSEGGDATDRGENSLPVKCSGPGCSPRHLPQPKPVVNWRGPVREMLLLSAAPKSRPEGRFVVDAEVAVAAMRSTTEIFRPPR